MITLDNIINDLKDELRVNFTLDESLKTCYYSREFADFDCLFEMQTAKIYTLINEKDYEIDNSNYAQARADFLEFCNELDIKYYSEVEFIDDLFYNNPDFAKKYAFLGEEALKYFLSQQDKIYDLYYEFEAKNEEANFYAAAFLLELNENNLQEYIDNLSEERLQEYCKKAIKYNECFKDFLAEIFAKNNLSLNDFLQKD